jgi:hypothetical protein
VGYINQEIAVSGRNSLRIALSEDLVNLEEVVIVGYGTTKKEI